jgi:hypothetical protein
MDTTDWPPPEGVCPRLECNGIVTALALQLDPRGEGECGRCGNLYSFRDGRWVHTDEIPDKPTTTG